MIGSSGGYLVTLPNFALYFACALALTAGFLVVYTVITPHREWRLIRAGNVAASVSLGGALIGFVIPLASTIAHSVSLIDMLVWGSVAMVVQLLVFGAVRLAKPDLAELIEADRAAAATFLASVSVAVGILNAACMTY
jgi:putative membrane protein